MKKQSGVSENLVFSTNKNIVRKPVYTLYNNRDSKGNVNKFLENFKLSDDHESLIFIGDPATVSKDDLVGWVEYEGWNAVGESTGVIRTKITVKLK